MLSVLAGLSSAATCATGVLNPQFLNLQTGAVFPVAPGDTEFVLVEVANQTREKQVTFLLSVETADGPQTLELVTTPDLPTQAAVFSCPVARIGLGELGNLESSGIRITNPETGQFFEAPWDRNPLTEGRSFLCGDTILFLATTDTSVAGSVVLTVGRIDGGAQAGPFSGADTFENLEEIVIVLEE